MTELCVFPSKINFGNVRMGHSYLVELHISRNNQALVRDFDIFCDEEPSNNSQLFFEVIQQSHTILKVRLLLQPQFPGALSTTLVLDHGTQPLKVPVGAAVYGKDDEIPLDRSALLRLSATRRVPNSHLAAFAALTNQKIEADPVARMAGEDEGDDFDDFECGDVDLGLTISAGAGQTSMFNTITKSWAPTTEGTPSPGPAPALALGDASDEDEDWGSDGSDADADWAGLPPTRLAPGDEDAPDAQPPSDSEPDWGSDVESDAAPEVAALPQPTAQEWGRIAGDSPPLTDLAPLPAEEARAAIKAEWRARAAGLSANINMDPAEGATDGLIDAPAPIPAQ